MNVRGLKVGKVNVYKCEPFLLLLPLDSLPSSINTIPLDDKEDNSLKQATSALNVHNPSTTPTNSHPINRQHARRSLLLQVRKHDRHQQLVPVLRPPRVPNLPLNQQSSRCNAVQDELKSLPIRRCLHCTERGSEAQHQRKGEKLTPHPHINQAGKWPPHYHPSR
ncbi:hypothetical protein BDP81DRAFT_112875 [Colletotrichum phormii]|uniref:Uncharacterized protein n=1 Tax=Colletotrichum phormii TaxID=359342 RepID=A0AAI9ZIK4_9PEZI|nr:uncharacterized protein BDP81DRAFT_112875 [Colletotrichum phormii]KAK1624250.1 hypothetical protein BDP81DRAFT_112875 [Colletotrichum phormii]